MLLPNLIEHDFFALSLHSVSAVQTTWRPGLQRKKLCKPARDKSILALASASCKPNSKHTIPPKLTVTFYDKLIHKNIHVVFFTDAKPSIWKGTKRFKIAKTKSSSILKMWKTLHKDIPARVVRLWQQMEQARSHEGIEAKSNLWKREIATLIPDHNPLSWTNVDNPKNALLWTTK